MYEKAWRASFVTVLDKQDVSNVHHNRIIPNILDNTIIIGLVCAVKAFKRRFGVSFFVFVIVNGIIFPH